MLSFPRSFMAAAVLMLSCLTAVLGQSETDTIRAAVESENWQSAFAGLRRLRQTDVGVFQSRGFDYLLGRVAEKIGDTPTALSSYQSVIDRNSKLSTYAFWHIAHIARSTGDLVREREYLRRIISISPQTLLLDSAILRLGESLYESKDYEAAANSLKPATSSKNIALAREASVLTAESFLRSGKTTEARELFTKLIMLMPDASRPDDFALTAVRELDDLDKSQTPQPKLSESERILRGSIYQFNRDFSAARTHYQALIDQYPQSVTVPNAFYQIGRGEYSEGKYEDARTEFQKVVDQFPQTPTARDALGYLASSYMRMKRTDDAVTTYKALIDRFPDAPNPERPYLNIIDVLHEAGRYSEAISWVQQTRSRFKMEIGGALAVFAQLRIHLAQNNWQLAIADSDALLKYPDLGGTKVAGGTTSAEVSFLRAYSLESLGRVDDAITGYLAITDGRNEYYGSRATRRLIALAANDRFRPAIQSRLASLTATAEEALAKSEFDQGRVSAQAALRLTTDETTRVKLIDDLKTSHASLPAYRFPSLTLQNPSELFGTVDNRESEHLCATLASLGLYDEAIPELLVEKTSLATGSTPSDSYSVVVYSLRGGFANRAVKFGEQLWKSMPADYVIEAAPRNLAELLYPAPHRASLLNHAPKREVDPRFVLSIARQESRYQADAKSVSAARGIMQFIPATANEIATQLKLKNFMQDDLYDADTAILFGSQYLANLFRQFPNQPDAVAAAYNGGADNMARWKARSRADEPDRYVAEIGFAQTKDYVFRVMTNLWNYQKLYNSEFKTPTSLSNK